MTRRFRKKRFRGVLVKFGRFQMGGTGLREHVWVAKSGTVQEVAGSRRRAVALVLSKKFIDELEFD